MAVRVLVVDDDQIIRTIVSEHLRRGGCEVEEAADGVEALEAVRKAPPDVVVTDLGMPRLDGLGLLRELTKCNPDLPAIVLTAHDSVDEMVQAIREGILFDYQIKPPDLSIVDMAVRRAAEVRTLRARAREADQVGDQDGALEEQEGEHRAREDGHSDAGEAEQRHGEDRPRDRDDAV